MNLYSLALFVHVVGAVLLFAALTVEGVALWQGVRQFVGVNRVIGPLSALAVVIPGFYMTATQWGPAPWILGGLVSWLLIAAVGAVTGIRLAHSAEAVPLAAISWWVRAGLALGAVFLMTVKPGSLGTLVAVCVGALVGAGAGVAAGRRPRPETKPA